MEAETTPQNHTINDIAALLRSQSQQIAEFKTTMECRFDKVDERITDVEKQIKSQALQIQSIEKEQESLRDELEQQRQQIQVIHEDTRAAMDDLEEKFKEEHLRIANKTNIILMGVPETDDGLKKAKQLMTIIMPTNTPTVTNYRLGKQSRKGPRPLRISLSSEAERRKALSNCHLLKDNPDLAGVSVKPQLTRKQRLEASQTKRNSRYPLRKRKQDEEGTQPAKRGKTAETAQSDELTGQPAGPSTSPYTEKSTTQPQAINNDNEMDM